jgi:hypothetical protein
VDKIRVADNIRRHLERRIAFLLDCKSEELRQQKLGTLIHLLFMLAGDGETVGGFSTSIHGVLDLVGQEIVWAQPVEAADSKEEEKPAEKVEVIN